MKKLLGDLLYDTDKATLLGEKTERRLVGPYDCSEYTMAHVKYYKTVSGRYFEYVAYEGRRWQFKAFDAIHPVSQREAMQLKFEGVIKDDSLVWEEA